MTVTSSVTRNNYVGSGITGPYAFTFRITDPTHLSVITGDLDGNETTLAYITDYTVTGVGSGTGGTITLVHALTSGYDLTIRRATPITQVRSIRNQGTYSPAVIEDMADTNTAISQELNATLSRAILLPATAPASATAISNFTEGAYLRVKADGTGIEGVDNVIASQNFQQSGTGAVVRTMQSKAQERVSVKDFGAVGDGSTGDSAAIQRALNAVTASRGVVYFPNGHYRPDATIEWPVYVSMEGESLTGVVIDAEAHPLAAPIFTNKNSSILFCHLRNMTIRGGTWAIDLDVAATPQNVIFDHVSFEIQTVGYIHSNLAIETCAWHDCTIYFPGKGLVFDSGAANQLNFYNTDFIGLTGETIDFSGCTTEGLNFYGCHFEGGGADASAVTFKLNEARSVNFYGGYIEGTNKVLISETNPINGIAFYGTHITFAADSGAYTWDTTSVIQFFGAMSVSVQQNGPARMMMHGIAYPAALFGNNNALTVQHTKSHKHFVSAWAPYPGGASASFDLVHFTRANTLNNTTNAQIVTGRLVLSYHSVDVNGFSVSVSRQYLVKVLAVGSAAMAATFSTPTSIDVLAAGSHGLTVAVQQKSGASTTAMTIEAVVADTSGATLDANMLQWQWEDLSASSLPAQHIAAALP